MLGADAMNVSPFSFIAGAVVAVTSSTGPLSPHIGYSVGTGGNFTAAYFVRREELGYPSNTSSGQSLYVSAAVESAKLLPQSIEAIADSLKLSAGDMAKFFGVSRQSIHNWKGGGAISETHQLSVDKLFEVAQIFSEADIIPPRGAFLRPLEDGRSFFDVFKAGDDVAAMTSELIETLQMELEQKLALSRKLRNRSRGQGAGRPFTGFEA